MSVSQLRDAAVLEGEFPYIPSEALARIPSEFARQFDVLAYHVAGSELHVIVVDEQDERLLDRIRVISGMRIKATSAPREWIRNCLSIAYDVPFPDAEVAGLAESAPAIVAMDEIHSSAIAAFASDIHIEPSVDGGRVRFRIDGMLNDRRTIAEPLYSQLVSRIKLLAEMDIADKRQPQDGGYQVEVHGRVIDARVSSMPTIAGEKLVVRLLDYRARVPRLDDLGMSPAQLTRYRSLIHAPHGFVIVCGPTGSGKTTTLYASLSERNVETQHVCTVEDPVEIRLPGIAQVQVHPRAGVTFAKALRSFMRQDPNVIMVGEMRDAETAAVAMSAALSGQLVVTTLHASDVECAIDRLVELGLKRHALAAGLSGIVAQRLVRRLCSRCRVRAAVSDADRRIPGLGGLPFAFESRGCASCAGSGYSGRIGVFECLRVTRPLRAAIGDGAPSTALRDLARAEDFSSLLEDGAARVISGDTSISELRRVMLVEVDA